MTLMTKIGIRSIFGKRFPLLALTGSLRHRGEGLHFDSPNRSRSPNHVLGCLLHQFSLSTIKTRIAFVFGCGVMATSAWCTDKLPVELDNLAMSGISNIQQLHFDQAERNFNEILVKYPEQPYGYFGIALLHWGRLEYEQEESSPELNELFEKKTDKAIEKGEAWLDAHPDDAYAHVCVGGMYGLRARLAIMKHRWGKAYFSGRKGVKHMNRALELAPEVYDAYLGQGMYEYYAGTLPVTVRWLAKLLVNGDARKGIEYITLVKDKGHFNSLSAQLLLIEIYTQTGSKYADPKQALIWANELREQYPAHPLFHFAQIVCLYETGNYDAVRTEANKYLRRIESNSPEYSQRYMPRALTALGMSYLAQKHLLSALDAFTKAEPKPNERPTRWAVWAVVREGNVYDLLGCRTKALEAYGRALGYDDSWGFKEYIMHYIKRPYTWVENPGQLPPP